MSVTSSPLQSISESVKCEWTIEITPPELKLDGDHPSQVRSPSPVTCEVVHIVRDLLRDQVFVTPAQVANVLTALQHAHVPPEVAKRRLDALVHKGWLITVDTYKRRYGRLPSADPAEPNAYILADPGSEDEERPLLFHARERAHTLVWDKTVKIHGEQQTLRSVVPACVVLEVFENAEAAGEHLPELIQCTTGQLVVLTQDKRFRGLKTILDEYDPQGTQMKLTDTLDEALKWFRSGA